jgi:hypothetical protein
MSPEVGFALILALLWGPTALWLVYRVIRGPRGRLPEAFVVMSDSKRSSQPAPAGPEALIPQGFWVCGACRSLNRHEANTCYRCQAAMPIAGQQGPDALPVSRRMVPVMAEDLVRSSRKPARTTVASATPSTRDRVRAARTGGPELLLAAAAHKAPPSAPACPFLGFRGDPTTRCSFPDPRNLCHASPERGAGSIVFPRRFITGRAVGMLAVEIGAEHQEMRCLTAAHELCPRYPAAHVVAAIR